MACSVSPEATETNTDRIPRAFSVLSFLSTIFACSFYANTTTLQTLVPATNSSLAALRDTTNTGNNKSSAELSDTLQLCELPPCEIVLQSRLYSERCGSNEKGWPLLVTGTPRSATVYATRLLQSHGMRVVDDWQPHRRDGRVSWMYAFDDPHSFGPAQTNNTFNHVLHQMKNPLGGITSMCTEPIYRVKDFLERHVNLTSLHENPAHNSRVVLEWWVEWHTFLQDLDLPSYQIENVQAIDIFRVAGLEHVYQKQRTRAPPKNTNKREHRDKFTWQELFTIDPHLSLRAWKLAHFNGYEYSDVDFDKLTCLPALPHCDGTLGGIPPNCPPGSHPVETVGNLSARPVVNGWTSWGCVEYKRRDGTYVGLNGVNGASDTMSDTLVDQLL